jgi:hypothetical protein
MSKENTNQDGKTDTGAGAQPVDDLTTEQKLDNLARNMFVLIEKQKDMGLALDNVYVQVATLIEVLAMDEKILNPKIWEEKLKEVTQNIKDTMEAMTNEEGNNGQGPGANPGGPDAPKGNPKIIVPDNKIIIPGQ